MSFCGQKNGSLVTNTHFAPASFQGCLSTPAIRQSQQISLLPLPVEREKTRNINTKPRCSLVLFNFFVSFVCFCSKIRIGTKAHKGREEPNTNCSAKTQRPKPSAPLALFAPFNFSEPVYSVFSQLSRQQTRCPSVRFIRLSAALKMSQSQGFPLFSFLTDS